MLQLASRPDPYTRLKELVRCHEFMHFEKSGFLEYYACHVVKDFSVSMHGETALQHSR